MRKLLLLVALGGAIVGYDLGAPPSRQWTARTAIAGIRLYQKTLSPWLATSGVKCRFEPTCSHYAVDALHQHGALFGGGRAAWRIARCGPWTSAGTVDPVD